MKQSVINSIMKPHRTRGESKYMLEEIYFSDICGDIENKDDNGQFIGINPQKAWFDNGKYRFQFPPLWYQSTCNNKAIGLRSVELVPDSVSFAITIQFYKRENTESEYAEIGNQKQIIQQFLPNTSLMEILSTLTLDINNKKSEDAALKNIPFKVGWRYNYKNSEAALFIFPGGTVTDIDKYMMLITVKKQEEYMSQCGFYECFNTTEQYLSVKRRKFIFNNVWNRESLFVHASFVNGTSFQVLGTSGEFYPKPSKMYRFNGNSPDFYFELSYDGIHPIQHKFARFIVQLAYIYNDADYMAE